MNKLTKVGLSALAGSLAAVSAHAVDYSVTGDAQVVYSSAEGNEANSASSNGKGIGVDTDLYFTAGGELDNGFTVSVFTAMDMEQSNTATSGGLNSSAQLTIGMGSLGTVQFNDVQVLLLTQSTTYFQKLMKKLGMEHLIHLHSILLVHQLNQVQ